MFDNVKNYKCFSTEMRRLKTLTVNYKIEMSDVHQKSLNSKFSDYKLLYFSSNFHTYTRIY